MLINYSVNDMHVVLFCWNVVARLAHELASSLTNYNTPGFKGQSRVHLIHALKNNTYSNRVYRDKCHNIIRVLIT
jgi:hypothetical protein